MAAKDGDRIQHAAYYRAQVHTLSRSGKGGRYTGLTIKQRKDETDEQFKERNLKYLEKISKKEDPFLSTTPEERDHEQKEYIKNAYEKWGIAENKTDTEKSPEIKPQLEYDEWSTLVKLGYANLKKEVNDNLPQLWLAVEFILSIKSVMNIEGITLPWFGIILGRPSSLKTAAIELLRDTPNTFYTDIFTPKAFVSNSTAVAKDKLKDIDMLPKLKDKLFLVSELSAIFTKKDDEVVELLGILTRLADGHGLKTNTGAHGDRGYSNVYFNMIGAAVDIPRRVYMHLGYLGPKLYFLRMPKVKKEEKDYLNDLDKDEYPLRFQNVQKALNRYLNAFNTGPMNPKMIWSKDDDSTAKQYIVKLGMLLSHLRAVVPTWRTEDTQGKYYAYATAIREEPDRAIVQLRNLARGHALSQGRNFITLADIPLVIKVVLSTASIDRVNIFDLLISSKGELTAKIISDSLNMSAPVARATMTELKAIELVDMPDTETQTEKLTITLKSGFKWFLNKEFSKLREEFKPEESSMKEKCPPSQSTLYECPRCHFRNTDPSKITEHRQSFHGEILETTGG